MGPQIDTRTIEVFVMFATQHMLYKKYCYIMLRTFRAASLSVRDYVLSYNVIYK